MQKPYVLVRDHLEQAAAILSMRDLESRQVRNIIDMTIKLIEDLERYPRRRAFNVIDFRKYRNTGPQR